MGSPGKSLCMPERKLRVGITGIEGLIGWHLRACLHGQKDVEVSGAGRAEFRAEPALARFAAGADVVVHLAGMNRGDDRELETVNKGLADALIQACESQGSRPHVILASSAHITRDTAYARSKRYVAERLQAWAQRSGARFTCLVLPHVFGEFGKPFYNSAVSTFCHQLTAGEEPKIIVDAQLELLHAQRVAEAVLRISREGAAGELPLSGTKLGVSQLLARLKGMAELYRSHIIPDLREDIDLDLFNTLRSYMYPSRYPVSLAVHSDARGGLFEAVKARNGGQSFISSTKPGVTRGNHYHRRKVERFLVLGGRAVLRIRKLFSTDTVAFEIEGGRPQYVDIPTLHTHNITNVGDSDLTTLFWAHEIFDPRAPDTVAETV